MSIHQTQSFRATCDLHACGLSELMETGTKPPSGWFALDLENGERRTFHSIGCLRLFLLGLGVTEFDGNAEMVSTVGSHLVWREAEA